MHIALFIPCFVDQLFPSVGIATVTILRRLHLDIHYPPEQTCCGQPAFNTGYWHEARTLAQRYRQVFADADAVVCPSGSCTAMVRNFYPQLGIQPPPTYELSEFLVKKLRVTDLGATFHARVTYHDACHALRELRLKDEPRQLLRHVRGLELIETSHAETCCGFGGTFSVKFPAISRAIDHAKSAAIAATAAQYVVSTDSSCLMHLNAALRQLHCPVKPIHLAEILACT